jgi:hypothetical protein
MQQFDLVIYYTGGILGSAWPSSSDWNRMKAYLDGGGNILWSGHFPAWSISWSGGSSFLYSYFGAQQVSYHYFNYNNHYMVGTNGNLEITGNWMVYYNHPEIYSNYYFHEYVRVVGNGVREMYCQSYSSSSYATMISVEGPNYQTVLMTFDLNLINLGSIQAALMAKILDFFSSGIAATVDVHPETLNLDSNGNWVSVEVEGFPDDPTYDPSQVVEGTVTLENIGSDPNGPSGYVDGAYKCKVDRLLLEDAIGAPGDSVELIVAGDVADTSFAGTTTIRAIHGV